MMRNTGILLALFFILTLHSNLFAYSVLAHEATIDFCWKDSIEPLLTKKFPRSSAEDLRKARAYAYGGSIIQDLGYYPFGNKFLSDLLHYVRSADFVEAMLQEAQDVNEYAFALGALSHYVSDSTGHPLATNRVVPILYPDLRAKYGDVITYDEKPSAHIKVEFGYDVLQVARGKYAPEAYHDFIGFEVSKDLLDRALFVTYGLHLNDILMDTDLAIGTFRHTVSSLVPELTKVAWDTKEDEIRALVPDITPQKFLFRISRTDYESRWGATYQKPGFFTRVLGFFIRILPKVGPLKTLAFKVPTPETERLFLDSFEKTVERYRAALASIRCEQLPLVNRDLDTGAVPAAGEYRRADKTYAKLLLKLNEKQFQNMSASLRQNILGFFKDKLENPADPAIDDDDRREVQQALKALRVTPVAASTAR